MEHKITLYQFDACPYCVKVKNKLDELGLKYKKVNVARSKKDKKRKEIASKSGVLTVPVIEIDGKFTGESGVIIEKLKKLK